MPAVQASGRRLDLLDMNCVALAIENACDQGHFAVILFGGLLIIQEIGVARHGILKHVLSVALCNPSRVGFDFTRIGVLVSLLIILETVRIERSGTVGKKT